MGRAALLLTVIVALNMAWLGSNKGGSDGHMAMSTFLLFGWFVVILIYLIKLMGRWARRIGGKKDGERPIASEMAAGTVASKIGQAPVPPPLPVASKPSSAPPPTSSATAPEPTEGRGCIGAPFYALLWLVALPFKIVWWLLSAESPGSDAASSSTSASDGGRSIARPYMGGGTDSWWEFDGKMLRPYAGSGTNNWWEFDGRMLKPYMGSGTDRWWEYDGRMLKPYMDGGTDCWWEYDGKILKPCVGGGTERWWQLDGKILKPYIGGGTANWWEFDFPMPLPVMAKIIGVI